MISFPFKLSGACRAGPALWAPQCGRFYVRSSFSFYISGLKTTANAVSQEVAGAEVPECENNYFNLLALCVRSQSAGEGLNVHIVFFKQNFALFCC